MYIKEHGGLEAVGINLKLLGNWISRAFRVLILLGLNILKYHLYKRVTNKFFIPLQRYPPSGR